MSAAPQIISNDAVRRFQQDGAVVLREVLTDWVEPLITGVAKNMAEPSQDVKLYRNEDGSGLFFGDYCNWDRIAEYRDFMFNSPAAAIAAQLTGSTTIRIFHEHVLVKEPGTNVATPWHHDLPYYCVDGQQTCSVWMPLDTVPLETCPEFIAGSHRWGQMFRPERFNKTALNEGDGLAPIPDIDNNREQYDIKHWDMQPGDAIAFNFLTLHGAPPNNSTSTRRRAFSSRWIGDDCTFAKRMGVTSPPFRDVTLRHGETLDSKEFPLVYTA